MNASAPFVGRTKQLGDLSLRVAAASAGKGSIVLVAGDAGIGKSRLVREFLKVQAGQTALIGHCLSEAQAPFGPFAEISAALRAPARTTDRAKTVQESIAALLSASDDPVAETHLEQRRRRFDAVADAVAAFSRHRPTTLVIEDIHWVDSASLELIVRLAADIENHRTLVIATYRPDDLAEESFVTRTLQRLQRTVGTMLMHLAPLNDDEIDAHVQAVSGVISLDLRTRDAIRIRAAGNPLFAEELARFALSRNGGDRVMPNSIMQTVLQRCRMLTIDERHILQHAAVIGPRFNPAFLSRTTNIPLPDLVLALRRARDLHLLVDDPAGSTIAFQHPLTREALYDELLAVERQALHSRIMRELEAIGVTPETISELAFQAWGARDAAKALLYNERSGDEAMRLQAPLEASRFYERAIEFANDDAVRARLHEKNGRAYAAAGLQQEAEASFAAAIDHYGPAATEHIADLYWELSRLLEDTAPDRSRSMLHSARKVLEVAGRGTLSLRAMTSTALIHLFDGDITTALEILNEANPRSNALDAVSLHRYYVTRARALCARGDFADALSDLKRGIALSTHAGNSVEHVRGWIDVGRYSLCCGREAAAQAAFQRAAEVARRAALPSLLAQALTWAAGVMLEFGDFLNARATLAECIALAGRLDVPSLVANVMSVGLRVAVHLEDTELRERLERLLPLAELLTQRSLRSNPNVFGSLIEVLVADGRAADAQRVISRADRETQGTWAPWTWLAIAAHGTARDVAAARKQLTRWAPSPGSERFLWLFDAIGSRRDGERPKAADQAVQTFYDSGLSYAEAYACELDGRRSRAAELYAAFGTTYDLRRVSRARTGASQADQLTRREAEVAELVAKGNSNRVISAELFISEKTVETHLTTIYAKLGVRSRTELAARLLKVSV